MKALLFIVLKPIATCSVRGQVHLFPQWLRQDAVDWTDEEDVSAAVERFLGQVSTLFPVHEEVWNADLEAVEWRLYEIPVIPLGFDLWPDDWADLREPAPCLLHMQLSRDADDHLYGRDTFAGRYSDLKAPPGWSRSSWWMPYAKSVPIGAEPCACRLS